MRNEPVFNTAEVLELLRSTEVDQDRYRGGTIRIGTPRVFGGQMLGQALQAAFCTVKDKPAASLHAVFVLPGDLDKAIDYQVERVREGRAFSSRRVVASQDGLHIFNMTVLFHREEEGVSRFMPAPSAEPPHGMAPNSPHWRHRPEENGSVSFPAPVDFRCARSEAFGMPFARAPTQQVWARAPLALGDSHTDHQSLFAYISDYGLLWTAIKSQGLAPYDPRMQASTLSHTIWFHRPFRMDDWLLLSMSSPSTAGGRGLNLCHVYDGNGEMVASVAQEGLFRFPAGVPPG